MCNGGSFNQDSSVSRLRRVLGGADRLTLAGPIGSRVLPSCMLVGWELRISEAHALEELLTPTGSGDSRNLTAVREIPQAMVDILHLEGIFGKASKHWSMVQGQFIWDRVSESL